MGLAGAKNKRKLGNDPNNTKWSRNTDTFGQKILRAQGWQPGEYLGAKDAAHAEWHTEANTTHIRVTLKDDTLGLGAKRNNGDECTGLDAFQHLLGRLNGKSDEALEAEQKVRNDVKLSLYIQKKFGMMRFVKGGWLVGDQVKQTPDEEAEEIPDSTETSEAPEPAAVESKKRKADRRSDKEDDKLGKKEKKSKKRKAGSEGDVGGEGGQKEKDKKSKRRKTESDECEEPAVTPKTAESLDEASGASEAGNTKNEKKDKKRDKKEKKERRDKKEKKEKRRIEKAAAESGAETGDSISEEKKRKKKEATSEPSSAPTPTDSNSSTPTGSGYSTPIPTGSSRYLARSRFIAQKKMAFADSAALNQIFMIKS
uniref:Protein PXR1 n=1 Tax=Chaetomium globosum (strain ATCC 6205 / CBS 148.51 / DSM 1962 / NBRC 6347 / NRRL 1970) TaxID=306901 RepID=PXR1_CHAGB|nr:RecName: Full=Protein PXR1; AltName: Full=PinX1-related protein 1 [Chaetomium globosum CBS 148.51]